MATNPISGLKYVITYHRFTGNTYFNTKFGHKSNIVFKVVLTIVSMVYLLTIIHTMYSNAKFYFKYFKMNTSKNQINENKKSFLIFILLLIGTIGYSLQTLFEFIILLMRGKHILEFFQNQDFITIDSKTERRIGLKILLFQILLPIITTLTYFTTTAIMVGTKKMVPDFFCTCFPGGQYSCSNNSAHGLSELVCFGKDSCNY